MSGAPAIDTRSQNHIIKQKTQKVKQTKKQKTVVFVVFFFFFFFALFSHLFALFSHYFAFFSLLFCFFSRSLRQKLLTGKSPHKCRSGTRKNKTHAKTKQIALLLHFHLLFFFSVLCFLQKNYLMVGNVWLPLPNINLGPCCFMNLESQIHAPWRPRGKLMQPTIKTAKQGADAVILGWRGTFFLTWQSPLWHRSLIEEPPLHHPIPPCVKTRTSDSQNRTHSRSLN